MCWTESGAKSDAWSSRPVQIGNPGDRGLMQLLKENVQNRLVLPPNFYKGGRYELTALQAASTYNNADVDEYTRKLDYCLWVLHGGAQDDDAARAKAK